MNKRRAIGYTLAGLLTFTSACSAGRLDINYVPPTTEAESTQAVRDLFACGPGPACIEGQLPYEESPKWVQRMFTEGTWVQVSEGTIVGADDEAIITAPDGQQYVAGLDQATWLRLGAGQYHIRVQNSKGLQQWVRFIGDIEPLPQQ